MPGIVLCVFPNYLLAWAVVVAMIGAAAAAFSYLVTTICIIIAVVLGLIVMIVRFVEIWSSANQR